MTNTPSPEQRLDQIERILNTLASNQIAEREARLAMREDLEILYQATSANTTAISQLREELHSEVAEVVGMIGTLAHAVEENSAYIRALVDQAAIDRASFQTSLRDILAYLQTRYNGNGGGQQSE